MSVDALIVTAAVITVVWSVFSCVFGVLVAKSIQLADDRQSPARGTAAQTEQQRADKSPPPP